MKLKEEASFHENKRFLFTQLLLAFPKPWKNDRFSVKENIYNLVSQDHHLIRKHHLNFLNRSAKKIYNFLISQKDTYLHQGYFIHRSLMITIFTGEISTCWYALS